MKIIGLSFAGCTSVQGTDAAQVVSAQTTGEKTVDLNVAVEYTDHAASFYYAQGKSFFRDNAGI